MTYFGLGAVSGGVRDRSESTASDGICVGSGRSEFYGHDGTSAIVMSSQRIAQYCAGYRKRVFVPGRAKKSPWKSAYSHGPTRARPV